MNHQPPSARDLDTAERLLHEAMLRRASDLHLEPAADGGRALLRVDGLLEALEPIAREDYDRLVTRIKVLAGIPVYRRDTPQEGRLRLPAEGNGTLHARVATLPTTRGEKVGIRLFHRESRLCSLDHLGLPTAVVDQLRAWTTRRRGVVLLTGPSGAGKTTTIHALLYDLLARAQRPLNICAIEDPVEQELEGVIHTAVCPELGLTFASGLRAMLRQDPDVLVVGEIRDAETARTAIQAGLTGHLVLSSLHSGDTAETFLRLLDMGLEPYLIASAIRGVVGQRLVRALGPNGDFQGRTALAEGLTVNDAVREAVLQRPTLTVLRRQVGQALEQSLMDDARAKVDAGLTTMDEVRRVLAEQLLEGPTP